MKRFSFVNKFLVLLTFIFAIVALAGCKKPNPTLSFDVTDIQLEIGETYELKPQITELEGEDLVNYNFSSQGVVSVSNNIITAEGVGNVTINASLKDYPEVAFEIKVTVISKVKSIQINMSPTMIRESKQKLNAAVAPSSAENKELEWSVSDSSIIKIEGDELVAVAPGEAKVIAKAKDGSEVTAELLIKVSKKQEEIEGKIELSADVLKPINGSSVTVVAKVETEADDKSVTWSVVDDKATVTSEGVVTFTTDGKVEVVATLNANPLIKQTIVFNVTPKIETLGAVGSKAVLRIGDSDKLSANFDPIAAYNEVLWSSSDPSTVSVDENGNVMGLKAGKATITVTAKYQPELSATIEITVYEVLIKYYVSPSLAGKSVGDEVNVGGLKYVMGTTAFADLDDALDVVGANEIIYVASGTYEDEYTISQNGITIIGPNEVVDPNYDNRNPEATFTNLININSNVSDISILGVCFTKGGRIVGSDDGGIKNLLISNVVFDSQITNGDSSKGCIHVTSPAENFSSNLQVINCRFEKTGKRTQPLMIDGIDGLSVKNSYFEGSPGTFNDTIKCSSNRDSDIGMKGKLLFEGNEFVSTSQYTIWLVGGVIDATIDVIGNTFTGCGDHSGDYVRAVLTISSVTVSDGFKSVINVQKNVFDDVDCGVRVQYGSLTEKELEIKVNDNKFLSWRGSKVIVDNNSYTPAGGANLINADRNYFEGGVKETLLQGVNSYANEYKNVNDVPVYERPNSVTPTGLFISNKVEKIDAFSEYQVKFLVGPANATNKKVIFESSDDTVAKVSSAGTITTGVEGTCTITVTSVANPELTDSFTFEIIPFSRLELDYEGNGVLFVGEKEEIEVVFINDVEGEDITFTSSDEKVATVDATGCVTAVGSGNVIITATTSKTNKTISAGFTVLTEDEYNDLSGLMQLLIDNNSGVVLNQDILYIGSDDGSADYLNNVYGSVNNYYAADNPEVIRRMLPTTRPNHSKMEMKSIEFITVHDTAGSASTSTALNNNGWCINVSNTATSWHYTIGNDGIYQSLEDNIVGRHAGDGGSGTSTEFTDTGIEATVKRPECTLGEDGYIYILGQKSSIKYPEGATGITETGLGVVIGDNGNYWMPTLRLASQGPGEGKNLCIYGGNANSIGIETAVNDGSDVYLTWQILAKHCASLLVKYELNSDRVRFHNSFDGKLCPRTMMTAGLVDQFLAMVEIEYLVALDYSDAKITFTSNNPEIIDNSGRVVATPEFTTNVTYTVTVEFNGNVEEITLNAIIIGQYNIFE